jgi:type II secretory pathway component PulC
MRHFKSLTSGRDSRFVSRAADIVRPGGEALLLAGVALGCVQLGWATVSPNTGIPVETARSSNTSTGLDAAPLRSPFAPMEQAASQSADAVLAALAGVKVVGVRMADVPGHSGAILAFPDGRQRPFLVGYEVSDGVVLSEVNADRIVVSFDGGSQSYPVDASAATGSFALALMGRAALSAEPAVREETAYTTSAPAPATERGSSEQDAQWLMTTLSQIEMRNGAPYAWRVASAPPRAASDAGLREGDLILTVNGVPPGDPSAVLAAVSAGRVAVAIERASGERKLLTLSSAVPS